ncbi:MAG: hypothetical protein U0Q16_05335 [Bryobacteraceae bacterium]
MKRRSAWALFAGFLLVVVLSLGTDQALHMLGIYPPWSERMSDAMFAVATAYRLVYGIAGSYLTARLAPSRPMAHALVGAAIGTLLATAGAAATWDRGPEFGPHWYPVTLIVTGLPCAWVGATLARREITQPHD